MRDRLVAPMAAILGQLEMSERVGRDAIEKLLVFQRVVFGHVLDQPTAVQCKATRARTRRKTAKE